MPLYRAELLAKKPLRYAALIHDVSQVLYLPFDYDDGSYARDRSGYNNHGTIYGATLASGKIGMAREFDGVDDYVEVADAPSLDITDAITIEGWINLASYTGGRTIVEKSTDIYGIYFTVGAEIPYAFLKLDVTGWTYLSFVETIPLNKWVHLAFTYDRKLVKDNWVTYVNGTATNRKTIKESIVTSALPLQIGRYGTTHYFNGIIDELRIYNRALSLDEIRMLMYRRLV